MVNWKQIGKSFDGLKRWIKIWILILVLINCASFFLLSTPIGQWTAAAAAFIALSNSFLIIKYSGLTRVLALPHFIWFPLIAAVIYRMTFDDHLFQTGPAEFYYGMMVVAVNSVSLLFDVNDSVQWFKGKREILGLA